jgi:hypothetical protein
MGDRRAINAVAEDFGERRRVAVHSRFAGIA